MVNLGYSHQRGGKGIRYQQHSPDLISQLPNELKIKILSLLEMKEAVKTGVLSKKWKNLWMHINNIVYFLRDSESGEGLESKKDKLVELLIFIDHTLVHCSSRSVKKFTLCLGSLYFDIKFIHDAFDKWLEYVLCKNVEFVKLQGMGMAYAAPNCLCQSSSFVKLEIGEMNLCKLPLISWTSLNSLCLKELDIQDESINNILLGSPVLETLVLDGVYGINHLNIIVRSLKRLIMCNMDYGRMDNRALKINAPWLKELEISGFFLVPIFELVNASSLENAALLFKAALTYFDEDDDLHCITSYHSMWIRRAIELINYLCKVGELSFGSQFFQVFSLFGVMGEPRPVLKCKQLRVISPLWKYDLPGIACLLECAPDLETLFIEVRELQEYVWKIISKEDEGDFPLAHTKKLFSDSDPHLSLSKGNFKNLKNVKIDFVRSSCCESDSDGEDCFESELVGYILRSAIVLEKLIIFSSRPYCDKCKMNCKFQRVPILSSKLITTFLAGNEGANWELRKENSTHQFNFSMFP